MNDSGKMAIHITIAGINCQSGGPSASVTSLSYALAMNGVAVNLYALDSGEKTLVSPTDNLPYRLTLQRHGNTIFSRLNAIKYVADSLKKNVCGSFNDIIHDNGAWLITNRAVAKTSRRLGLPLVISTHGMFETWALNHKKMKKQLAWFLYQKKNLETAALLHATAEKEARNLRKLGLKMPIAVIPNGVNIPCSTNNNKDCENAHTVLFLSRIHPVKGLVNLVGAWNKVRPQGWRVKIVGPDEVGHLKEIKARVSHFQLDEKFEFLGPVYDDRKWELFASADLFVLPSFTENFGIVIAEALAAGLPVITTKATPWQDLVDHSCGWWVDVGVDPLADALSKSVALSDADRYEMGQRGRKLVEESYSWKKIAADMASVYEWILGGGSPPTCVMTD